MTTYDFTGRTAVVTGGSRGIGYATAELLLRSGANVVVTSRKADAADAAANSLAAATGAGDRVLGLAGHVADEDAATRVCDETAARFGGLDVLVNNAGTNPAYGPVTEQSRTVMQKVFDVNVTGPAVWSGAALRAGLGRGHTGSVVNVSSIGALFIEDGIGVYNASKSAIMHLTRQMAHELAPTVRVNSVAPGIVRTRLSEALWKEHEAAAAAATPLGRIGEPSDVADAVCFLASPSSSWITGSNLVVDGGQLVN
ncbi:SDR family oxidoreductase [Corynebacterium sp.]|uniref:SDR family oxidoreductase n=1 Tax=Corynebacterium sp. TaxID=1720 RepID=UPI0025C45AF5|nr:SDR family oxidoreductase [Corynebacterium sp.]